MKKKNDQSGFTLIEVVFSILMLTIGILGAAVMQDRATQGNSTAIHQTGAVTWASGQQEALLAQAINNYNDTALTDANNLLPANAGVNGLNNTDTVGSLADSVFPAVPPVTHVVQGITYTVFWNVANNYPVNGTKTIRVITRYPEKGVDKTITIDFTKTAAY